MARATRRTPPPPPLLIDDEAASQPTSGPADCFFMDMGLKGGIAQDQDEEPILFNDGVGFEPDGWHRLRSEHQSGTNSDRRGHQGLRAVVRPERVRHRPLVSGPELDLFTLPNPGPPFTDWPPLECIKTRTTGSMNQLERGLDNRFFGSNNAPCPADSATGPVKGRNYWHRNNNLYDGANFADNGPPVTGNNLRNADPRLVTIFLAPTEAFTGPGQKPTRSPGSSPSISRGTGGSRGNGSVSIDDPCPGSAPPTDLDLSGGYARRICRLGPRPEARRAWALCDSERTDLPASHEQSAVRCRPGRVIPCTDARDSCNPLIVPT